MGSGIKMRMDLGTKKQILIGLYVAFMIIVNIVGAKIISAWGVRMSAGVLYMPFLFIIADTVCEVFGEREAKRMAGISVFLLAVLALCLRISVVLPAHPAWDFQEQYELVFSQSLRMTLASIVSFLVSQRLDVFIFSRMRSRETKGKRLYLRNAASTALSQLADTFIFMFLAYYMMTQKHTALFVLSLIWPYYLLKLILTVASVPLCYLFVWWCRNGVTDGDSAMDGNARAASGACARRADCGAPKDAGAARGDSDAVEDGTGNGGNARFDDDGDESDGENDDEDDEEWARRWRQSAAASAMGDVAPASVADDGAAAAGLNGDRFMIGEGPGIGDGNGGDGEEDDDEDDEEWARRWRESRALEEGQKSQGNDGAQISDGAQEFADGFFAGAYPPASPETYAQESGHAAYQDDAVQDMAPAFVLPPDISMEFDDDLEIYEDDGSDAVLHSPTDGISNEPDDFSNDCVRIQYGQMLDYQVAHVLAQKAVASEMKAESGLSGSRADDDGLEYAGQKWWEDFRYDLSDRLSWNAVNLSYRDDRAPSGVNEKVKPAAAVVADESERTGRAASASGFTGANPNDAAFGSFDASMILSAREGQAASLSKTGINPERSEEYGAKWWEDFSFDPESFLDLSEVNLTYRNEETKRKGARNPGSDSARNGIEQTAPDWALGEWFIDEGDFGEQRIVTFRKDCFVNQNDEDIGLVWYGALSDNAALEYCVTKRSETDFSVEQHDGDFDLVAYHLRRTANGFEMAFSVLGKEAQDGDFRPVVKRVE